MCGWRGDRAYGCRAAVRLAAAALSVVGSGAALIDGLGAAADAARAAEAARVFEGYCGHNADFKLPPPEAAAFRRAAGVSAAEALGVTDEAQPELLQLQVLFRHGARTLWGPWKCWAPQPGAPAEPPHFDCKGVGLAQTMEGRAGPVVVQKSYEAPGRCGVGSLLPEARYQFESLAASLRASFVAADGGAAPSWWDTLDPHDPRQVFLYACDNDRNLGSMTLLLNFLFETAGSSPLIVNTPENGDDLFSPPSKADMEKKFSCGAQLGAVKAAKKVLSSAAFKSFVDKWLHRANVTWTVDSGIDCVIASKCAGVSLPEAYDDDLMAQSLYWAYLLDTMPVKTTNVSSFWAVPAWQQVMGHIRRAAAGDGVKLAMWSIHDTTQIVMLNAFSAWGGVWPPFANAMSIELYRWHGKDFLRFASAGKPIILKNSACFGELCPLESMLQTLQELSSARERCEAKADRVVLDSVRNSELSQWYFWMIASCFAAVMILMFAVSVVRIRYGFLGAWRFARRPLLGSITSPPSL
eukprot:TRINITY_DN26628_c0_g1_i1.p1 TRINITY_DN26628_c0_g1~~TRINITY_DN26628_c0_g1_i1.p1  ORF type:complete len:540 (+),score=89.78 TRINITY_DN26628_c0_g1_i1:50-1621(+)